MSSPNLSVRSVLRLKGQRVLVLGDLMLDEYIYGIADRISPEAPVPIVRLQRRVYSGGGAANTASNVACLGGTPHLIGVVGPDRQAERLKRALAESSITDGGVILDADRPTTVKTRVVAHGQQVLRIDQEETQPLSPTIEEQVVASAVALIPRVDAVVLCDYAKGVVTERVCRVVLDACRKAEKPSLVDPKGWDYRKYRGVSLITPNLKEAQLAVAHLQLSEDPCAWGQALLRMLDGSAILITKGAAGMTLHRPAQAPLEIAARARSVYDVTGAGDTVVATASVSLGAGVPLEQAVWLANVAAGIVVRKAGTSTTTLEELAEAVTEARRNTALTPRDGLAATREIPGQPA